MMIIIGTLFFGFVALCMMGLIFMAVFDGVEEKGK